LARVAFNLQKLVSQFKYAEAERSARAFAVAERQPALSQSSRALPVPTPSLDPARSAAQRAKMA
jgi:hypothetical protein